MRKSALALLFPLTLLVGACNTGSQSPDGDTQNSAAAGMHTDANAITGTVSLKADVAAAASVSPSARLELILEDTSQQPPAPIARKTIDPVGALPIEFKLDYNPDKVVPDDVLIIVAKLTDGERKYTMPLQYQVLTHNAPSTADIQLVPEPTAAEQMLADFRKERDQLGAMRMAKGSSLNDTSARAWQVFKKNNHVRFVVDIEDNFDTGVRQHTDYAYRDGVPWVVVQKHMPKAGAAPDSILRAGWDKDGKLVVRESEAGGQTDELADDQAKALRRSAEAMLKQAAATKD